MLALDATTRSEYDAGASAAAAAQAVIDALADPVTVRVYDGSGNVKGSGTMATPWATQSGGVLTAGELSNFSVTAAGTPDATWYLRFESGARWLRGSFGLAGATADFVATATQWAVGHTAGLGSVVLNATEQNTAPSMVGAPSSLSFFEGTGGSYDFAAHGYDPDGDALTYALVGIAYSGITVSSAGVLTVDVNATAAVRNLVLRVTDPGGLSTDWPVQVTIAEVTTTLIRYAPGHYFRPGLGDSLASILSKITGYDSRVRGLFAMRYWNLIETSKGVFDWSWHDAVMNAAEAAGKVVIFSIQDRRFNNAAPSASVPAYLQTEGLTFSHNRRATGSPISGCTLWRPQGMTYCIDAYKRLIDRYGHRSALVGLRGEESIYGNPYGSTMGATYTDYNATDYMAQEVRRMQELRAYAPQLSWSLYCNFVQGDNATHTALQTWFAACRADRGVLLNGGPDVGPLRSEGINTDGEEVMLGIVGGVNHLGQYLINQSSEQEEWEVSGMTVQQIYNVAVTQRGANVMSWATNSVPVDPDTGEDYDHWTEEVYPYLATHPANSTVPTQLVGRVQVI